MSRFRYRAAGPDGKVLAGSLLASSESEADAVLLGRGLHPLSLRVAPARARTRAANRRDLALVFRSLSTLVEAGVPLERAMTASAQLARSEDLRSSLLESRRLLIEGHRLADALRRADGPFPPVVTGMLEAGERGSRLDAALEQAAVHLEREAELSGRVRQALAYPAVLLTAGVCSVAVITTVVVPRFAVILGDLGQSLPPATRALLALSGAVRAHGMLLLILLLLLAAGVAWLWQRPAARLRLDRLLLGVPVIGSVRHGFATARASQALGSQLATGVPILSALEAARVAAGDNEVARRIQEVGERVRRGEAVASAMNAEATLTPAALQLLSVGDSSGRLGQMANRAGEIAALEAENGLRLLVSLLEPFLVVLFGGLVAFTAAALLQAVYSLRPGG